VEEIDVRSIAGISRRVTTDSFLQHGHKQVGCHIRHCVTAGDVRSVFISMSALLFNFCVESVDNGASTGQPDTMYKDRVGQNATGVRHCTLAGWQVDVRVQNTSSFLILAVI
jgi:hypothetical protein